MLKVSASYLKKQKSFNAKKNIFLAVVNIKTKKLCLLTQFSGKVLGQPLGFDTKYLAQGDINMQVRFSFKVIWKS